MLDDFTVETLRKSEGCYLPKLAEKPRKASSATNSTSRKMHLKRPLAEIREETNDKEKERKNLCQLQIREDKWVKRDDWAEA